MTIFFVIPSIVIAYMGSIPSLYFIWHKIYADNDQVDVSPFPNARATFLGLLVGIFIPTVSAIIPIYRALSKSLTEALNVAKATTTGLIVSMTGGRKAAVVPYVLFGTLLVGVGVSIYILLPQSLLSLNLGLLLDIFFLILLGMILGLTLLAVNLRGFLEKILVYVLLFWERKSMRRLLRKNLAAHRSHNYLTSIIYSLTLGCVIFLLCSAN